MEPAFPSLPCSSIRQVTESQQVDVAEVKGAAKSPSLRGKLLELLAFPHIILPSHAEAPAGRSRSISTLCMRGYHRMGSLGGHLEQNCSNLWATCLLGFLQEEIHLFLLFGCRLYLSNDVNIMNTGVMRVGVVAGREEESVLGLRQC